MIGGEVGGVHLQGDRLAAGAECGGFLAEGGGGGLCSKDRGDGFAGVWAAARTAARGRGIRLSRRNLVALRIGVEPVATVGPTKARLERWQLIIATITAGLALLISVGGGARSLWLWATEPEPDPVAIVAAKVGFEGAPLFPLADTNEGTVGYLRAGYRIPVTCVRAVHRPGANATYLFVRVGEADPRYVGRWLDATTLLTEEGEPVVSLGLHECA